MDSLTQIVLGASVAEATLGKKIGNKAIVLGAIAGTIPDLDIVTRFFVDDLTASVMHRGFSHSLIFPFGEAFRLLKSLFFYGLINTNCFRCFS